ncbi:histidine phosphatase family protein [Marinobacterium rhizophilum]|uniref:Histidine phosphatase family protein n=1 Tax=Marinobacterium rhizophilum TaxID=420402 RepID=A0ABY5HS74_9GAMM|nr:histidine phosphatase family protein [Marinobacterium rhizophilum]UTW13791.1 histidine phosphatase family protein [Marinobacterium rhizophilum]
MPEAPPNPPPAPRLELICLRHGPTEWNRLKRLQGHHDEPLLAASRQQLDCLRVPERFENWHWYSSPLLRARETAQLLGLDAGVAAALIEMDWGDWEGQRISDLRLADPAGMAAMETQGLDLCPPNGESPRQVQQRLTQWAESLRSKGIGHAGALCHKGVIRALLAAACRWDMRGKAPRKLEYSCLQHFAWDGLQWHLQQSNVPLQSRRQR